MVRGARGGRRHSWERLGAQARSRVAACLGARDTTGQTPAMLAASRGRHDIADLLRACGGAPRWTSPPRLVPFAPSIRAREEDARAFPTLPTAGNSEGASSSGTATSPRPVGLVPDGNHALGPE